MKPSKPCFNFQKVCVPTFSSENQSFVMSQRALIPTAGAVSTVALTMSPSKHPTEHQCGRLGTHINVGYLIWWGRCCCCCCCTEGLQITFQPEIQIEFVLKPNWIFRQWRNTIFNLSVHNKNDTFLPAPKCRLSLASVRIAACMRTLHIAWGLRRGGSASPLTWEERLTGVVNKCIRRL